jgi:hypothetical protein
MNHKLLSRPHKIINLYLLFLLLLRSVTCPVVRTVLDRICGFQNRCYEEFDILVCNAMQCIQSILRTWRCRRIIPPKHRLTFNRTQDIILQKIYNSSGLYLFNFFDWIRTTLFILPWFLREDGSTDSLWSVIDSVYSRKRRVFKEHSYIMIGFLQIVYLWKISL